MYAHISRVRFIFGSGFTPIPAPFRITKALLEKTGGSGRKSNIALCLPTTIHQFAEKNTKLNA